MNKKVYILMLLIFLTTFIFANAQSIEPDFHSLFDGHGSVMLLIDTDTEEVVYANEAAIEFYGYPKDEILDLKINDINILTPEEIDKEIQEAESENRNHFIFKHKLSSGEIRTVEVHSYPYNFEGNSLLFSIINDITPRVELANTNKQITYFLLFSALAVILIFSFLIYNMKKKNSLLRQKNAELENFYKLRKNFINADDRLIYLKDQNLKYIFVNTAVEKFYDMTQEEIISKTDFDITQKEFAKLKQDTDLEVLDKLKRIEDEVLWDGRLYKTNKFPIDLLNGSIGVGAYIEDITEEKKVEEEREQVLLRNSILVDVFRHNYRTEQEQLDYVLHRSLELTKSEYGYIYFYDSKNEEFTLNSWSKGVMDACEVKEKKTKYKLEETGLWGEAVRQRRAIIENDFDVENELKKGYPEGHVKLKKFLTVPIIIEGEIEVVVGLANKKNDYDENDIYQITVLMTGVWNALERREKSKELEQASVEIKENKEHLQLLLNSTAEGIYGIDTKGECTFINDSALKMLGYKYNEVVGKNMHDLIHYRDKAGSSITVSECKIVSALKKGKGTHVEDEVFWKKDGSYFSTEYYSYPQEKDGQIVGAVVTFIDNTERKRMQDQIYSEKEQFRTTLLSVGDGVIATDSRGRVKMLNPIAEELTGWKLEEAIGKPFENVFNIINEYTREKCENPVERVLQDLEIIELANHTVLISKDGEEIPIEDSAAPIKNREGKVTGVVVVFRDFSEKKEKIDRIEYLSLHDHLTGLYNRRYMEDSIDRLDTLRNLPFTIMVLDVNGLKLTNDAFGHAMGDKLLVSVANMMKNICRKDDILGRMGGDEFMILLPKTNRSEADVIKKMILAASSDIKLGSVIISLAVGYATKERNEKDIKKVVTEADNNMYKDKLKYGKIMRSKTIETVLKNINNKYDKEQIHTERVSQYCETIAKEMDFQEKEIEMIKTAGILHDIGKIMVPPEILNKPSKLTNDEFELIKGHPETSYQILKSVDEYAVFAVDVLYHHERIDGKGYPEGLKGDEIPINARIIAVADAYEAMTAERPYQPSMTKEEAIVELKRNAGTQFDFKVVDIFVNKVLN